MNARIKSPISPDGISAARYLRAATLLLMFMFLTVSFIIGAFQVADEYREAVDDAHRAVRSTAVTLNNHAGRAFGEAVLVASGIAELYWDQVANHQTDMGYIDQVMADKLKVVRQVAAFLLVGPDGKIIADASNFPLDKNTDIFAATPAPPARFDTEHPFVGNPVKGIDRSEPDRWFLPVGANFGGSDIPSAGFAVALIDVRVFEAYYRSVDVGRFGRAALWTADGYLAVASKNERQAVGSFDSSIKEVFSSEIKPLRLGDMRVAGPSQDNPPVIEADVQVDNLPLMVTVKLSSLDYLREWRSSRNRMIFGSIGINLAAIALAGIILSQLQRTRQNAEALRTAKAVAEEANAAKSRFLAHMSHEFRTPLNAIMGFSDIIQSKTMGDSLAPVYVTYASHIYRSGEHLLEIVNEILDMSKIESGIQSLQREVMDLAAVIESAVAFLERMASAAHLEVRLASAPQIPRIIGDERFVRQVLINLLSNAIKFSPPGNTVTVRVTVTRGETLDCSVIDHGPGIEPMILARIGEPFLQGNPSLSRAGQGTGLGLSICKHYMDLLGGALLIDSTLGVGTTVTMRFPRVLWSTDNA